MKCQKRPTRPQPDKPMKPKIHDREISGFSPREFIKESQYRFLSVKFHLFLGAFISPPSHHCLISFASNIFTFSLPHLHLLTSPRFIFHPLHYAKGAGDSMENQPNILFFSMSIIFFSHLFIIKLASIAVVM